MFGKLCVDSDEEDKGDDPRVCSMLSPFELEGSGFGFGDFAS